MNQEDLTLTFYFYSSPDCRHHRCDRRRLLCCDQQEQQHHHQHHQRSTQPDRDLRAVFGTTRQVPGRCEKHCWSIRATGRRPRQHSKDRHSASGHARCRELRNVAKLRVRGTPNNHCFCFDSFLVFRRIAAPPLLLCLWIHERDRPGLRSSWRSSMTMETHSCEHDGEAARRLDVVESRS